MWEARVDDMNSIYLNQSMVALPLGSSLIRLMVVIDHSWSNTITAAVHLCNWKNYEKLYHNSTYIKLCLCVTRYLDNLWIFLRQIKYLRSRAQVNDLVDTICAEQMADYAQARWKDSKEATIIRIIRHDGGMNPLMAMAEVVPDEQLNTRLWFK